MAAASLGDQQLEEAADYIDHLHAKIDALMMEYCPNKIIHEQWEEWAKHQSVTTNTYETDL